MISLFLGSKSFNALFNAAFLVVPKPFNVLEKDEKILPSATLLTVRLQTKLDFFLVGVSC